VLAEMPGFRAMVVGDMAELGAESAACHREVGDFMLCQQLAQASYHGGFIVKMFAHAAGAADIRAQGTDAEDAIQPFSEGFT
jgi:UDP-N-acetylmuramyl pentapeptide synthase